MNYHKSVLRPEAVDSLCITEGKKYIDATFGGGGHVEEIIKRGGIVLGIDVDNEAIADAKNKFESLISSQKLFLSKGNFSKIDEIAKENNFTEIAGVLFDLGLSSNQIDRPERGFSYLKEGPLDMRMDQELTVTAADLLKVLGKGELYEIFNKLGEETRAHAISNGITRARRMKDINTTDDLVEVLKEVYKVRGDSDFMRASISKKVFQALRMAVNDELGSLKDTLPKAYSLLQKKGRIVVITFHSLEDRIVKKAFIEMEKNGMGIIITKKPILPSVLELRENPRSKSAKLRVFEKI